jgi:predicted nucleic acid-binding Zn ribbon protein
VEAPLISGLEGAALADPVPRRVYFSDCAVCGRRFGSSAIHAKFCSGECHRASLAARRRKGPAEIPLMCVVCGRAFIAGRANATTCGMECRAEDKRRRMRERAREPGQRERQKMLARARKSVQVHCTICGRDMGQMPDLQRNRYTCSPECRAEALRRKQRRAYEKRRNRYHLTGLTAQGTPWKQERKS